MPCYTHHGYTHHGYTHHCYTHHGYTHHDYVLTSPPSAAQLPPKSAASPDALAKPQKILAPSTEAHVPGCKRVVLWWSHGAHMALTQ